MVGVAEQEGSVGRRHALPERLDGLLGAGDLPDRAPGEPRRPGHTALEGPRGDPVDVVVSSLGYPVYVLLFLGILKLLGAAVIASPGLRRLKEWAYAGSFFQIALAAGSHAIAGTDLINLGYPIVVMLLTLVSWALRPADRVLA